MMIRTLAELDAIRDDCRKMVTRRSLMSAGASVIPVPGADFVADIGLLTNLLPAISARFGLGEDQVRKLDPNHAQQVLVYATSLGNTIIGRVVTRKMVAGLLRRMGLRIAAGSVARYVPIIGSAFAATISFGAMKIAGNAHIEDCYATARVLLGNANGSLAKPVATPKRLLQRKRS